MHNHLVEPGVEGRKVTSHHDIKSIQGSHKFDHHKDLNKDLLEIKLKAPSLLEF
jgi:hypothetical protein